MSKQSIIYLAVAVMLLGTVALVLNESQQASDELNVSGLLFPDLKTKVNSVVTISLQTNNEEGEQHITLRRQADKWVVAEKFNYAADQGALTKLVKTLVEAKLVEKKTQLGKNYALLGLADPAANLAVAEAGLQISLVDEQGSIIADLILGKNASQRNGSYVRKVGEQGAWMIDKTVSIGRRAKEWLQARVTSLSAAEIQSIQYRGEKGELLLKKKDQRQAHYELADIGDNEEYLYPSVTDSAANALTDLSIEDVRLRAKTQLSEAARQVQFKTFDGLQIKVEAYKVAEEFLLSMRASKERSQDAEADKRVAELNQRWQSWLFVTSSLTFDQFNKKRADFVEEKVGEKEAGLATPDGKYPDRND